MAGHARRRPGSRRRASPNLEGALNGGDEAPDRRRSFEATKEGRGIVMRVPLEGGGRLVVELTPDEAAALGDELKGVTS